MLRRLFMPAKKKTSSARSLAPPFQIEPAALGFDLVLGVSPEVSASILLRRFLKPPFARFVVAPLQRLRPPYGCDVPRRGKVRFAPTSFCAYGKNDVIRPLPCSSFPNRTRCAGLRFGIGRKPGSLGIYTVATFSRTAFRSFCRGAASKAAAPIWLRCSAPGQSPLCSGAFLYLWHKDVLRLLPCSSSPNHKR